MSIRILSNATDSDKIEIIESKEYLKKLSRQTLLFVPNKNLVFPKYSEIYLTYKLFSECKKT